MLENDIMEEASVNLGTNSERIHSMSEKKTYIVPTPEILGFFATEA